MTAYKYNIKYCDLLGKTVAEADLQVTNADTQERSFELALEYAKAHLKPHRMIESINFERMILL